MCLEIDFVDFVEIDCYVQLNNRIIEPFWVVISSQMSSLERVFKYTAVGPVGLDIHL
ncbi:hypothetical protein MASR1M31_19820 [Porphyromonadaceae bacterium]